MGLAENIFIHRFCQPKPLLPYYKPLQNYTNHQVQKKESLNNMRTSQVFPYATDWGPLLEGLQGIKNGKWNLYVWGLR